MSTIDHLYDQFVERYFASGEEKISEDWPAELKERCRVFVKLARSYVASVTHRSIVKTLTLRGIQSTSTPWSPGESGEELSDGDERYVVEKEIARGGMGRVLLAYDRDFRRRIAMKVLLSPAQMDTQISRFVEEAQATAQLEHPNIAPVYDIGFAEANHPFFTMKWIRGCNLAEIVGEPREEFTLFRLVQILQQAAMGIDFANSRNVVHRDLKPQNIMVGDYGEVLVVDWGIAKILGTSAALGSQKDSDSQVTTLRTAKGINTLEGTIQGSLPFMAPEQARGEGDAIDPRTDVFGLGAILYFVLTAAPPYDGATFEELLGQAREAQVTRPGKRRPERNLPAELERTCMKALSRDPVERFQSAREFHDSLQEWVEGIHEEERRVAEATRLLGDADRIRSELEADRRREAELRREEASKRRDTPDHRSVDEKKELFRLAAQVKLAAETSDRRFNETTSAYQAVLRVDPQNSAARESLTELYFERMLGAERRGDAEATRLYEGLVEQFDDGRAESLLRGMGNVRLQTDRPGATVWLSRYEEKELRLIESPPERLGETPNQLQLPMGSYLAVLRKPGYSDVRYPFVVGHAGAVQSNENAVDATVPLYPEGSIPEGFVQIPAGDAIIGGRSDTGLQRACRRVEEFFVGRFPVTLGEYCEFLNDRFSDLNEESQIVYERTPGFGRQRYAVRDETGSFAPIPELGFGVPALGISSQGVADYCAWRSESFGRRLRLPTEVEWERCARGADGRLFPWGNEFDWAFCHGAPSREAKPSPQPVGSFGIDSSPFGVRDLAGGIREFCEREGGGADCCKGGSWFQTLPLLFRCDSRTMMHGNPKVTDVGFRVCYSVQN